MHFIVCKFIVKGDSKADYTRVNTGNRMETPMLQFHDDTGESFVLC